MPLGFNIDDSDRKASFSFGFGYQQPQVHAAPKKTLDQALGDNSVWALDAAKNAASGCGGRS